MASGQHIILPQPDLKVRFEPGKFAAFYIGKPKAYWLADVTINVQTVEQCQKSLIKLAERKTQLNEIRELLKADSGSYMYNTRGEIYFSIERINSIILYIENCIKCLENGGSTTNITDKRGHTFKNVPDFTNIDTSEILFDEETILTDPIPKYVPIMDLETLVAKNFAIDAIEISKDRFLVSNSYTSIYSRDYDKYTFKGQNYSLFSILTLDQLVLTSDYYATKQKAVYKDEAEKKNKRNIEYWHGLSIDKKRPYVERLRYGSLSASERKQFTQAQFDAMSIEEKAKNFPQVKRYGVKRVNLSDSAFRRDGSRTMPGSLHYMYEDFVDPTKVVVRRGRERLADRTVWDYWEYLKEALKWKLVDISEQRKELSESRKAGMETSYGMANVSDQLLDSLGIYVKRQNGDKITAEFAEQIQTSFVKVQSVFGGLSKFTGIKPLVISHSANTYMYAMRAIGVFIPSFNAIGVSAKYGPNQFNDTMAHELAHYIDHEIGKQNGRRYLTDDRTSIAAEIAEEFRFEMNKKTSSDYLNSSKECFARALQMHFAIETRGMQAAGIYDQAPPDEGKPYILSDSFVSEKKYTEKIKPLINVFFKTYAQFFQPFNDTKMQQKIEFEEKPMYRADSTETIKIFHKEDEQIPHTVRVYRIGSEFFVQKFNESTNEYEEITYHRTEKAALDNAGLYITGLKKSTIKDRISKNAAELNLKEIKEKGFIRVAQPEKVAARIKKETGADVVAGDGIVKMREISTAKTKDTNQKRQSGAKGFMATRLKMAARGDFQKYTQKQVLEEAKRFQKARTKSGAARDEKTDSQKRLTPTPENLVRWMKDPGKYDLIGVDTYEKNNPTADLKIKKDIFWHRLLKK